MRAAYLAVGPTRMLGIIPRKDVFYMCLPMYHSSGGQLGISFAIVTGNKTIIKKKFSASAFWKDCVKYDVTVRKCLPQAFNLWGGGKVIPIPWLGD